MKIRKVGVPVGMMMGEMIGSCILATFTGAMPEIVQDILKPVKIIESGRATIFFWADGTKTVVKLQEGEEADIYGAFAHAIAKKVFGSRTAFKKVIDEMLQVETQKGDSNEAVSTSTGSVR